MKFGSKKVLSWLGRNVKALNPVGAITHVADKVADTFKDDEFPVTGMVTSRVTILGIPVGTVESQVSLVLRIKDGKDE